MKTPSIALTLFALLSFLIGPVCAQDASRSPASAPDPATKSSVRWVQDLAQAKREANTADRPLLLFQLLGDLDQEFC